MQTAVIDSCPHTCTRVVHPPCHVRYRRRRDVGGHGASQGVPPCDMWHAAVGTKHGTVRARSFLSGGGLSPRQGEESDERGGTAAPVSTVIAGASQQAEAASWPALQPPFTYFASAEDAQSNAVPSGLSPIWKVLLLSDGSVTRHLQLLSGSPVSVECLSMRSVGWSLEGLPPGTELVPGPRVQRQVLLRCQPGMAGSACGRWFRSTDTSTVPGGRHGTQAPVGSQDDLAAEMSTSSGGGGPVTLGDMGGGGGGPVTLGDMGGGGGASRAPGADAGPATLPLVYASSWWNADTIDEYLRDKSQPIWASLSQGHVELYREVHALFRGDSPELEELLGCGGPFWGRQYVFWSGGRPLTLIYEVFSPRLEGYLGPADAEGPEGRR